MNNELTLHSIEISCDEAAAFELCANVSKWPEYFAPCKAARILSEESNWQLIEVTAKTNDEYVTWQSERFLYPETSRIDFHQSKPNPLLMKMSGSWRIYKTHLGVLLTLEHNFTVKDDVANIVEEVKTREDAIKYMHRSIDENTDKELNAIKNILETSPLRDTEAVFESCIYVDSPPAVIYQLLYDADNWPSLLPHCSEINMLYDDGTNQEFEMKVVGAQGKSETMRSIRRGFSGRMIEYFQPAPPPALDKHSGKWIITETEQGSTLKAVHQIGLSRDGIKKLWGEIDTKEALARVVSAIEQNSNATMKAIQEKLDN